MRVKQMYCSYDKVAMMYAENVFLAWNEEDAKRQFSHFIQQAQDKINPHDFMLLHLGSYDRVEGSITSIKEETGSPHNFVMAGHEALARENKVIPFPEVPSTDKKEE